MFSTWFTTLFFWAPVLPHSVHLKRLPSSRTSLSTYFSKILRSLPATEVVKSSGWDREQVEETFFYWHSVILFHVDFPTVMTLELLGTELAVIARREVWMCSLNVLPHVVHIPAPLSTEQTNNTAPIQSLLAVGLQVVVRIWEGIFQWWITIFLCALLSDKIHVQASLFLSVFNNNMSILPIDGDISRANSETSLPAAVYCPCERKCCFDEQS